MGSGAMTLMNLLSFLAGSLPFAVLLYLRERMHQRNQEQWMRIFSVASLAIPKATMDAEQDKPPAPPKPDLRKRISVPIPMPDQLREAFKKRA